jgi:tRNA-dihydrouridine synthase B
MSSAFHLGRLTLGSRALLSPLEAVSDVGFRDLCASLGAGLTWTEMIRAQAVSRNNNSALDLIDSFDTAFPVGVQFLAKTPVDLQGALDRLQVLATTERAHYMNLVAVDLNFGCPSPNIIKEGAGPALLKRRKRLGELFDVLHNWREKTSMKIGAIGCKIRLGLNQSEVENKVYLDVAKLASVAGLDYITVHARHAAQRSSEKPYWHAFGEIKEHVSSSQIKVIANGNIFSSLNARQVLSTYNVDAVMIARGAINNPWIFKTMSKEFGGNVDGECKDDYWPTEADINSAIENYDQWSARTGTKSKFREFHMKNFSRLLIEAKNKNEKGNIRRSLLGDSSDQFFFYPKNQHIK